MGEAKNIKVKVIPAKLGNEFIKQNHYSGKVVPNSQLHFGAFYKGTLHGVMSFGPSMAKRSSVEYVKNTKWNEFLELNRMAFDEVLPKNSESRCISIAIKLIKKNAPHIKWIVSFADATLCGDGTIYRASGFVLTGIKKNSAIYTNGKKVACSMTFGKSHHALNNKGSASATTLLKKMGYEKAKGFQIRYIYFIDKTKIKDLTVPILPFSKIKEMGASMYKGVSSVNSSTSSYQDEGGGAVPTDTLYNKAELING